MLPTSVSCPSCGTVNSAQAAFCSNCGSTLHAGSSPGGETSVGMGRLASGQLLNQRYKIGALPGQGGMGAVYKAQDIRFNNRFVAVKEMSQSGLSPKEAAEAVEQFKQEANILASLQHPNLPRIYDYFGEGGCWYLVMDYIEGSTLEDRMQKARLSIAEAVDIGIQLASVLDFLHTSSTPIIFRDVKPSNIMVTSGNHVYVIDFGIARFFKSGQTRDTVAYVSSGYAAPEQFGSAQTTPQSDIYSLGATLHQLLSGRSPASNTPNLWTFPPIQFSNPAVPPALAGLVMHMVSFHPHQRPVSMNIVRQELMLIQSHLSQSVASPLPEYSALPPTLPAKKQVLSTRAVVFGVTALVVVAVLVFASLGFWQYQNYSAQQLQLANQNAQATVTAKARAEASATATIRDCFVSPPGTKTSSLYTNAATPTAGPARAPLITGTPVKTKDGLEYVDIVTGTGPAAKAGSTVNVEYTGWLASTCTKLDSSYDRSGQSFAVTPLGKAQVIQGWNEGLIGMKAGGTRRLLIPPALGYGSQGVQNVIPPNATLVFDVTVLSIK